MSSPDISLTSPDLIRHVDSAIMAAADDVDRLTHRRFWNAIETSYYDWPNFQSAYPWRIWLDQREIADKDGSGYLGVAPVITTGVQSTSPVQIPLNQFFWQPRNSGPPFIAFELSRAASYSYGLSSTPQEDTSITGVHGYWMQTRAAGSLAAAVASSTVGTVTVSDSSVVGVGDVLIAGTEQMLVQDDAFADTGQQQTGEGCTTDSAADDVLTVGTGADIHAGEILQLDSEWMLATSVTGNNVTVDRAIAGTELTVHSDAEVYARRLLTVQRGFGGTTAAASYNSGQVLLASLPPSMVRELAIGEALNYVYQKTSGYARTIGENGASTVPGGSLPDLRNRAYAGYGRKARQRVI